MRWKRQLSLVFVLGVVGLAAAQQASANVAVVFVNGGAVNGNAGGTIRLTFAGGTTIDCTASNVAATLTNTTATAYSIRLGSAVTWRLPTGAGTCTSGGGALGGATTFTCVAGDLNVTGRSDAATNTTPLTLDLVCSFRTAGGCTGSIGGGLTASYSNSTQALRFLSGGRTLSVTATTCGTLYFLGAAVTFSTTTGTDVTYAWPSNLRMLSS